MKVRNVKCLRVFPGAGKLQLDDNVGSTETLK